MVPWRNCPVYHRSRILDLRVKSSLSNVSVDGIHFLRCTWQLSHECRWWAPDVNLTYLHHAPFLTFLVLADVSTCDLGSERRLGMSVGSLCCCCGRRQYCSLWAVVSRPWLVGRGLSLNTRRWIIHGAQQCGLGRSVGLHHNTSSFLSLTINRRGFGDRMVHTHSVVLWKNPDDGSTVLSQRYADAHSEPHVVESPPRVAKIVGPKGLLVRINRCVSHLVVLTDRNHLLARSCFNTTEPCHYFRFSDTNGLGQASFFSQTSHLRPIL